MIPRMGYMLLRPTLMQAFNNIDKWVANKRWKNVYFLMMCAITNYIWRARNDKLFGNHFNCHAKFVAKIKKVVDLTKSKNGKILMYFSNCLSDSSLAVWGCPAITLLPFGIWKFV